MSRRPAALSASSTRTYLQCPLKFRYQVVDGMSEPPTEATVKGTVVHQALEDLFTLPPGLRNQKSAQELLPQAWEKTLGSNPEADQLFSDESLLEQARIDTEELLANYFLLEHPENLAPRAMERFVDSRLDSGVLLRGIIDRIDESADGELRVVDYKTGRAPSPRFTNEALFQMRFYALLLQQTWRLPKRLQLLYLRSVQALTLDPDAKDIAKFQLDIEDLWRRIQSDALAGEFRTQKSRLCDWCAFQHICPAFGGVSPQVPEEGLERLLSVQQ